MVGKRRREVERQAAGERDGTPDRYEGSSASTNKGQVRVRHRPPDGPLHSATEMPCTADWAFPLD